MHALQYFLFAFLAQSFYFSTFPHPPSFLCRADRPNELLLMHSIYTANKYLIQSQTSCTGHFEALRDRGQLLKQMQNGV
jgi:hypothetical protein